MKRWYVSRTGQRSGPFSDAELRALATAGSLAPTDVVWREGLPSWVAAGTIRGLFAESNPRPTPRALPPPLPATTPASPSPGALPTTPGPAAASRPTTLTRRSYTVRRKVFKFFGAAFHLLDDSNTVVGYSRQKAFRLKEDIRVFTDESMTAELLAIKARSIIDFSATYDVFRSTSDATSFGSLRRRGWKSFVRDEWLIFGPDGNEVGMVQEDDMSLAVLRRVIGWVNLFSPQRYSVLVGNRCIATLRTNRNPFVYRLRVDFAVEPGHGLAPQLVLAAAILLAAIEGKQA